MSFKRVLFIRFSAIGDLLLTTPVLRFFREKNPQTRIDFLVKESLAELLQFHPAVHQILLLPEKPGLPELMKVRQQIRQNRYDAIFDLQKHWRSYFLTIFLKDTRVLRYQKYAFRRFLLVTFKWNRYKNVPEKIPLRYFRVFRTLDWRWNNKELEIFFPPETEFSVAETWSRRKGEYVLAFAPGAGRETKRWPGEKYASLIENLMGQLPGKALLIGGKDDESVCRLIQKKIRVPVHNLCGQTSLLESAAVLKQCDLVVTNDTGVLHMAAAVKTPVVAIYGPTVSEFGFFPFTDRAIVVENRGLKCRPCSFHGSNRCPKKHFRCMNEISVEQVADAVMTLLKKSGRLMKHQKTEKIRKNP